MTLDPKIWGPPYWFFLHTIALNYPLKPNETVIKKYYDFIQNLPLFIPNTNISNRFSKIIDDFPVTPYLDSRESFIKWIHFIHNKINILLEIPEKTLSDSIIEYYKLYESNEYILKKQFISKKKILYFLFIILLIITSFILYKI